MTAPKPLPEDWLNPKVFVDLRKLTEDQKMERARAIVRAELAEQGVDPRGRGDLARIQRTWRLLRQGRGAA